MKRSTREQLLRRGGSNACIELISMRWPATRWLEPTENPRPKLARTFGIAWRRIADVPEEPLAWLRGFARRVAAEQRRVSGRHEALIERISETVTKATGDHAEELAEREMVIDAMRDLSAM